MDPDASEMLGPLATAPSGLPSHEDLSPMEQAVLEEYERLAENMKRVSLGGRGMVAGAHDF